MTDESSNSVEVEKSNIQSTSPKKVPTSKVVKKKVNSKEKKGRKRRTFPTTSFEESFDFAYEIHKLGAGQKVRRITIFDHINKSPDSGPSRALVTAGNKYGLISGGYTAEYLELTPKGILATSEESEPIIQMRAKFELAIYDIPIYKSLYDKFATNRLPNQTVIGDIVKELETDLAPDEISAIVDTFIVNVKYLNLLRTISGAERIITIEHLLEEQPLESKQVVSNNLPIVNLQHSYKQNEFKIESNKVESENFDKICFYISPIGDEDTEFRKHSDLILGSLIEPSLSTLELTVKRADQISKPGIITKQIIEYILKSKLVIADLSYHNPNVFYELALRHAFRLPTVQIIRKSDYIPFDLSQSRTIILDMSDIYTLVPKLEVYKSEIANQARQALNDPDNTDNPVINMFPNLKLTI